MDVEIIGFIAGIVIFSAQIPQVIKSWRTKQTRDISLPLYTLLFTGIALLITYGFLINAPAIYVMNIFLQVLVSIMLYLKLRYGMK